LGDLAILATKRKDDLEPYWQDEKDWLCTVEFLPADDSEARLFATDIIGDLIGYAHLTNTRSLAFLGDPDASAYELLFSFASPNEKDQFLDLVRSNEDLGSDYIENDFSSPTSEEIRDARPLATVLPRDVVTHAALIATTLLLGVGRGHGQGHGFDRRLGQALSRGYSCPVRLCADSPCATRAPTNRTEPGNGVTGDNSS
jgi:hypothetical protein